MNNPSRLSLAAQSYAQRGWYVFPCRAGRKEPATRSGVYAATVDVPTIRRWWGQTPDFNIGIWTGQSDLVVIDLDLGGLILNRDRTTAEKPGLNSWQEMLDMFNDGAWIDTYTVVTAGNGLHLYFVQPEGVEIGPSTSMLGVNIDVRAGGSYVIAPPSVAEGPPYMDMDRPRWERSPYEVADDREPAIMPSWLVQLFVRPPTDVMRLLDALERDRKTWTRGAGGRREIIDHMVRQMEQAHQGERNATLNRVAYWLFNVLEGDDHGTSYAEHELRRAGLSVGLSEREVDKTIRSALRGRL